MNWYAYWTAYAVVITLLACVCVWVIAKSFWDAWVGYGAREGLVHVRPAAPDKDASVWYRGWECGWNDMASRYVNEGWEAYKGGVDIDAPRVSAHTWDGLLDEIDDHMEAEQVR